MNINRYRNRLQLDGEIWEPIYEIEQNGQVVNYQGIYQISNLGRIKSMNYRNSGEQKILKLTKNTRGYYQIHLRKNNEYRAYLIHRLVAMYFVDGYEEGLVVNHKDECQTNNVYTNLEWITQKENSNYGTSQQRKGRAKRKSVKCIELDMEFDSIKEAAQYVGCSYCTISRCLHRKLKTAYGYHWEYI